MSDVSRKIVPDKWSLNREPTGNQRPKVSILHKKGWGFVLFSCLNWNGMCEKECVQRHDDRYGGTVPSKNGKRKRLS